MSQRCVWIMSTFCFGMLFSTPVIAQNAAPVPRGHAAWILEDVITKAGSRFRQPGQERWMASVQAVDATGAKVVDGVSLVMQWPGSLALRGTTTRAVFAPGLAKPGGLATALASTSEVLLEDTLDGFLALHLGGASTRIVGTAYPDPGRPGSSCNVVTLRFESRVLPDNTVHSKDYWFDTATSELVRVVHDSGTEVLISNYAAAGANEFAGTLRVLSHGTLQYTIALASSAVGPQLNDGLFGGN